MEYFSQIRQMKIPSSKNEIKLKGYGQEHVKRFVHFKNDIETHSDKLIQDVTGQTIFFHEWICTVWI